MAAVDFEEATVVREMAQSIIMEHHPHLHDARDMVGYYFRHGSSDWAGKAHKCTAFERHVTGYMLFVYINHDAWKALKHEQRLALVDHELCHFFRKSEQVYSPDAQQFVDKWLSVDDSDSWSMRDHDVEEFSEIIVRHGLWEQGIEKFAAAVRATGYQMTFDDVMEQRRRSAG